MKFVWSIWFLILVSVISLRAQSDQYADNLLSCKLKSISIEGETNVNQFEFSYDSIVAKEVNKPENLSNAGAEPKIVHFRLPVHAFSSDNSMMNKDFYKLLKASEHPEIIVGIDKSKLYLMTSGHYYSAMDIELTMAGITKSIQGKFTSTYTRNGKLILKGLSYINLKDFSLDPPQKMLGLVKVNETILINFDVVLQ